MRYDEQRQALERFVAERGDRLLRTAALLAGSRADGDDLLAEVPAPETEVPRMRCGRATRKPSPHGDEEHDVPGGAAVIGPSGLPHTFWNPDLVPARYLIVMSAQTSAMLDELHGPGKLDRDELRELFARYGCELLG